MTTDDTTRGLSISLYHFLCQNIVGYEDHVKTLRMTNNVRDNIVNVKNCVTITSGSFGEGIEMKGSDLDIMHVLNYMEVHEDISSVVYVEQKIYFSMDTEDTKPGYTYLSLVYTNYLNILKTCLVFRGKLFISNVFFKQRFMENQVSDIHGPCLTDITGIMDFAYCLHNKSWVNPAKPWVTRSTNSWPAAEVKRNIINHGVLFVPIGVKGSNNEEIEWRLSFSVGEKLLIYTFSHTQLLCYSLLKILLRDVINRYFKDLLCSYFLKTIMFWVSEELHPSVWTPEHLIPCFMKCFRRLIYCVNYSMCPHYFIPDNNLFENKIEGLERQLLLNHLYTLHSYDWRCIFFSSQIPQFEISQIQHMSSISYALSFKRIIQSPRFHSLPYQFLLQSNYTSLRKHYVRSIYQLLRFESSRIRRIYLFYMSFLCTNVFKFAELTSRPCNKCMYGVYKTCLSYQLRNIHLDATSGWLNLASFFYITQQYDKALKLIVYVSSKCTLDKLCELEDLSDVHIELLRLRTFRKKGITSKLKFLHLAQCNFYDETMLPIEVQLDEDVGINMIPSVFYAHFLRMLCHYRLKNIRQCFECILDLNTVLGSKRYYIHNTNTIKTYSCNCFGVALQLLGMTDMAKLVFGFSNKISPEHVNTAFKRLSHTVGCRPSIIGRRARKLSVAYHREHFVYTPRYILVHSKIIGDIHNKRMFTSTFTSDVITRKSASSNFVKSKRAFNSAFTTDCTY